MVNFQSIKQTIINTDYGWNKPLSFIVLVPGASLIFQKIQVAHLISTLNLIYQKPDQFRALINSREYAKLDTLYQWHYVGSLIQIITLLVLSKLNPLFLLPTAISIYEQHCSNKRNHRIIQVDNRMVILDTSPFSGTRLHFSP